MRKHHSIRLTSRITIRLNATLAREFRAACAARGEDMTGRARCLIADWTASQIVAGRQPNVIDDRDQYLQGDLPEVVL